MVDVESCVVNVENCVPRDECGELCCACGELRLPGPALWEGCNHTIELRLLRSRRPFGMLISFSRQQD